MIPIRSVPPQIDLWGDFAASTVAWLSEGSRLAEDSIPLHSRIVRQPLDRPPRSTSHSAV
jgi:hypothetical protein